MHGITIFTKIMKEEILKVLCVKCECGEKLLRLVFLFILFAISISSNKGINLHPRKKFSYRDGGFYWLKNDRTSSVSGSIFCNPRRRSGPMMLTSPPSIMEMISRWLHLNCFRKMLTFILLFVSRSKICRKKDKFTICLCNRVKRVERKISDN